MICFVVNAQHTSDGHHLCAQVPVYNPAANWWQAGLKWEPSAPRAAELACLQRSAPWARRAGFWLLNLTENPSLGQGHGCPASAESLAECFAFRSKESSSWRQLRDHSTQVTHTRVGTLRDWGRHVAKARDLESRKGADRVFDWSWLTLGKREEERGFLHCFFSFFSTPKSVIRTLC